MNCQIYLFLSPVLRIHQLKAAAVVFILSVRVPQLALSWGLHPGTGEAAMEEEGRSSADLSPG